MSTDDKNTIPTTGENLIEAVAVLHSIGTSVVDIARRCHIDQSTTLHVIKYRTLPARQMTLLWRDDSEVQS